MSDDQNLKKVLTNYSGLEITFLVEDGQARLEFRSNGRWDLANLDDVVAFIDGDNIPIESHGFESATGEIGAWSKYAGRPVKIMIRVEDYFDGWELD